MRLLIFFIPLLLGSCLMQIREAAPPTKPLPVDPLQWDPWESAAGPPDHRADDPLFPNSVKTGPGQVFTYGPRSDGTEHFLVASLRTIEPPPGILALPQCFLPTSIFAGPSPLQIDTNTLESPPGKWIYPALPFRSTFFDLYPAKTPEAKGLLLYHSSIMLLSVAEQKVVENFRKHGWNVMVALPPDSLFRLNLPTQSAAIGTLSKAAQFVAREMDLHYLEQAHTTRVALAYLNRTRPGWLDGRRVLMGTSAGTFAMPAEALMNPGWDALIFVSGGTNLLSLYASGSGGLFQDTLDWVSQVRRQPHPEHFKLFTDAHYREIYRQAATLTQYHAGALAPRLRGQKTLMIAGTIDHIMPDDQALGLHRALGSPERWTFPLGHHLLALQLILEVDRIDRWLE